MAIKATTMSREGFQKLQDELEYLVTIRRKEVAEKLKEENLEFLAAVHCTGQKAISKMAEAFGEKFLFCETGKKFEFF